MNIAIEEMVAKLFDHMRNYQPHSINSVTNLICICFAGYLGIDLKEIDFKRLKESVINFLHKKSREDVAEAYQNLNESNINDKLLTTMVSIIPLSDMKKEHWCYMIEELIVKYFLEQLDISVETPDPLNKLCLEILRPVDGTFYDGVSGIGSTAIAAHEYARTQNGKLDIYAQEKTSIYYAALVVRAYVHEIDSISFQCGDSLIEPKFLMDSQSLMQFDYSIMFPPLGMSWKDIENRVEKDSFGQYSLGLPPRSSSEWLFIQHQYASLNKSGKGIIAVSSGALFNATTKKIRQSAFELGIIECVITLPPNMLPFTAVPLSLLVISGNKKPQSQILMIHADGLFSKEKPIRWKDKLNLDDIIINELAELYRTRKNVFGISKLVCYEDLEENEFILLPNRYIQKSTVETEFGRVIVNPNPQNWPKLKDIGRFYRGINISTSAKASSSGEFKIINYTDVQNGKIDISKLSRYSLTKGVRIENYRVYPGDVLISCKGSAIKICIVPNHSELVLLSINFIGIHINLNQYDPRFIKCYLDSPVGQTYLQNKQLGSSIVMLTAKDLEQIPLPDSSLSKQTNYVNELESIDKKIQAEIELLYTQFREVKWDFYQKIGLGKIMKKESEV